LTEELLYYRAKGLRSGQEAGAKGGHGAGRLDFQDTLLGKSRPLKWSKAV